MAGMAGFHSPFRDLQKKLKLPEKPLVPPKPPAPPPSVPSPSPAEDDEDLFLRAMQDVTPLKKTGHTRVSSSPPPLLRRSQLESEHEALAELYDLVAGRRGFDITDTDEYIEGRIIGLDTTLVHKLRNGVFSRQAYIDLHGMTAEAAQLEVERFLLQAVRDGLRCVLIIHGRGRNSPG
ncbi:MAG: Smr/MutS family endonuclease, partial [Candidatus Binatia bacterium]|nr:Smr/MutS family endonuclease [Candidatus Binatia bacterium]